MRKSWVKKGLVVGIILLFVGTSFFPCIGQTIQQTSIKDGVDIKNEPSQSTVLKRIISLSNSSARTNSNIINNSINPSVPTSTISPQKEKIIEQLSSTSQFFTENKGVYPIKIGKNTFIQPVFH